MFTLPALLYLGVFVQAACNCGNLDVEDVLEHNSLVMYGKIKGKFALVDRIVKGCMEPKNRIKIQPLASCTPKLFPNKMYLFGAEQSGNSYILNPCHIIAKHTLSSSDSLLLDSQVRRCPKKGKGKGKGKATKQNKGKGKGKGKGLEKIKSKGKGKGKGKGSAEPKPESLEITCADGNMPLQCNDNALCNKKLMKRDCPTAKVCKVNPCGKCAAEYFNAKNRRVCIAPKVSTPFGNEAPSLTCPTDENGSSVLTFNLPLGEVSAPVTYDLPEAADDKEGAVLSLVDGFVSGSLFELGDTVVTFRVEDTDGLRAECSFTVRLSPPKQVLEEDDTQPPMVTCPGVPQEDPTLPYVLVFEVPAGYTSDTVRVTYPLPLSADNYPGAKLEQVQGSAPGDYFPIGDSLLKFRVEDAAGLTNECEVIVRVTDLSANVKPVASPIPPQELTEGVSIDLDLSGYFSDADGDELVYYVAGLPVGSGLTVTFDSGHLVGVPSYADATAPQPLNVRIMAADGIAGRAIEGFELTVLQDFSNKPPVGLKMDPLTVTAGRSFKANVAKSFVDPDGTNLDYYLADLPYGSGISLLDNGELAGTPTFADATAPQPLKVRVMASDGKASALENLLIHVLPDPDNTVPLSTAIPPAEAQEGVQFQLDLAPHFSDDDGDSLEYFIAGLPTGSGLQLFKNGRLSGTPSMADALALQPLQISILASDGKASAMEQLSLFILSNPESRNEGSEEVEEGADTEPPTIQCPKGPLVVELGEGELNSPITYPNPVASDNRGGAKMELVEGLESGSPFPKGDTRISWRAVDAVGLQAECSFVITVVQESILTVV